MNEGRWAVAGVPLLAALAAPVILGGAACEDRAPVSPALAPSAPPFAATPAPTPAPTTIPSAPTPQPTGADCPVLTSWTSRIYNITDANDRRVDKPYVGGHVVVDSTPLFGGHPCNAEHPCGGRICEDPRGGVWWLHEGDSPTEERAGGYQLRIGPLREGYHRWRVCPRSDAQDADGQPVAIGWGTCTQGDFTVVPAP